MTIKETKKKLKQELRGKHIRIIHPWELLKLRYLNRLEVFSYGTSNILSEDGDEWKVVSKDRDYIINSKSFKSENDACMYFYGLFDSNTKPTHNNM